MYSKLNYYIYGGLQVARREVYMGQNKATTMKVLVLAAIKFLVVGSNCLVMELYQTAVSCAVSS